MPKAQRTRWRSKDLHLPPLKKTPKSQVTAEQPTAKKAGTYQKRYSTSKDTEEAIRRWYKGCIRNTTKPHSCWVGDAYTRQ